MRAVSSPLQHLVPGWFAVVMGLSGLALAWWRAQPLMGEMANGLALVLGALAALVFVLLALASLLRFQRHPQAWSDDARHPVRHVLLATLPVALILLATVATTVLGPSVWALWLWRLGAAGQLLVTWWVLGRWWRPVGRPGGALGAAATGAGPTAGSRTGAGTAAVGAAAPGLGWASVTPALLIPVVGHVLLPLAGVPLGQQAWAMAQFGVGVLFWPVVLALLLVRIAVQGLWAERLLPNSFILIAPPAVLGLSLLQLGAPEALAWGCWGIALFMLGWVAQMLKRMLAQPFGLAHWGISFPMAAFSALTLRLAEPGGLLAVLGPALLAISSLLVLALSLATLRGLRDGSLLAPETVAALQPVSG